MQWNYFPPKKEVSLFMLLQAVLLPPHISPKHLTNHYALCLWLLLAPLKLNMS